MVPQYSCRCGVVSDCFKYRAILKTVFIVRLACSYIFLGVNGPTDVKTICCCNRVQILALLTVGYDLKSQTDVACTVI